MHVASQLSLLYTKAMNEVRTVHQGITLVFFNRAYLLNRRSYSIATNSKISIFHTAYNLSAIPVQFEHMVLLLGSAELNLQADWSKYDDVMRYSN